MILRAVYGRRQGLQVLEDFLRNHFVLPPGGGVAHFLISHWERDFIQPSVRNPFAQILVDYIAAGHFGLYERIAEGKERRRRVLELAEELYPRISQTTELALAFNDDVEQSKGAGLNYAQVKRLSELGEQLAARIDLEDRLIAVMTPARA